MPKFRTIYLYLFSLVGLVLIIIGSVQLINLGLKTYVFTKADQPTYISSPRAKPIDGEEVGELDKELEEEQQKEATASRRQRDAAQAVSLLIVGVPIYLYHWNLARKEKNV